MCERICPACQRKIEISPNGVSVDGQPVNPEDFQFLTGDLLPKCGDKRTGGFTPKIDCLMDSAEARRALGVEK